MYCGCYCWSWYTLDFILCRSVLVEIVIIEFMYCWHFVSSEMKKKMCLFCYREIPLWLKRMGVKLFWTNWFKAFSVRTNEHVSSFELEFLCVLPLWIMWHFITASCYPHHPLGIPSKRNCVWLIKWWKSHGIISTKMALEGKYKHYSLCPIFSLVVVLLDDFFIMLAKVNWFKFCRTKFNSGMGGEKKLKAFLTVKSMHDINGHWGRYKELINGVLSFFRAKYRCMHKLRVNNNSFND